jgi:hypothetical protein
MRVKTSFLTKGKRKKKMRKKSEAKRHSRRPEQLVTVDERGEI